MTAAEISTLSGVPEEVFIERFGLDGKHIAADDEHVSDMSVTVANQLLDETGLDPGSLDVVMYFGSSYKDHAVWQAAPNIAHRVGAVNAFAVELDYVSCGSPVAVRIARDLLRADPSVNRVLAVAASRESHILDYGNPRSRFMFNFGDGAVAALFEGDSTSHEILGSHIVTDGSFSLDVKVPAGGSVEPASIATVTNRRHSIDVADPLGMKERLDPVSLPKFVEVAKETMKRSGACLGDIDLLCGIHVKKSMHNQICAALGLDLDRAMYLSDTGHMSGVDPLLALDRAVREGRVTKGEMVLLLAAGTGYTWAGAAIRW
ncbi:MAG: 3-oxoacyl-ACP synthase [Acidimicrobiales bacterium]|nr:3-oxoacyl-ACP synthase [Acidimicrobiales bacterium]